MAENKETKKNEKAVKKTNRKHKTATDNKKAKKDTVKKIK